MLIRRCALADDADAVFFDAVTVFFEADALRRHEFVQSRQGNMDLRVEMRQPIGLRRDPRTETWI